MGNIEKYLKAYWRYRAKSENYIPLIEDEIKLHSDIFPDCFIINLFPGDDLGVYPEHMLDDICPCYAPIHKVIEAINEGERLTEIWFEKNMCL
ncbi:MAG: hypothetical protein LBV47_04445 [Bacteroidales bacterium]|jgi:hypothetical protein|nr:hypothetical protein [Bacteroidales bacterium]